MTDNATATDAAGNPITFRTRERTDVHSAVQQAAFQEDDGSEALVRPGNPLPAIDTATQAKLDLVITALASLLAELGQKTEPAQTQAVSAASLPLPSGAATESTLGAVRDRLPASAHSQPLTDTQLRATAVPMSAAALPLPAGAATSALQGTGNTSLASIDSKTPALSGGKVPVTDPTSLPLPAGAATEQTLQEVNARLSHLSFLRTIGKFSFTNAGELRASVSGSLSVSQCNIAFGDWGKPASMQNQSQNTFQTGIGRNFART